MKTVVASVMSLLVGLAVGGYAGYWYYDRHTTNEAIKQMVEGGESSQALLAHLSAQTIGLIDSGQDQQAVQMLSFPIASYYFVYATSAFTNEQRLRVRATIEKLASTNQIVAARIAEEMGRGKKWERTK
jgi:hypothetical protein